MTTDQITLPEPTPTPTPADADHREWIERAAAFADGDRVMVNEHASSDEFPNGAYVSPSFKGQWAVVERQYARKNSPQVTVRRDGSSQVIHSKWLVKEGGPAPAEERAEESAEVSRLRQALSGQRVAALRAEEALTEFKQRVYDMAKRLGREHDWCGVVDDALDELGLGHLTETVQQRTYRVTVSFEVTASRSPEEDVSESFLGDSLTLDADDSLTIELDDDWEDAEFSFAEVAEVTDITGD